MLYHRECGAEDRVQQVGIRKNLPDYDKVNRAGPKKPVQRKEDKVLPE